MGAGLAKARAALEAAGQGKPGPPPTIGDDLTPEQARAEAEAMRAERDAAAWAQVCPSRFRHACWEWVATEHGAAAVADLQAWAADPKPPNLVLLGPVGTGKTAAALLACKQGQLERGQGVLFYPAPELLDALRPGGAEGAMTRMLDAPRLVIDDLGTEKPTDWTAERQGIVVNRRWMEERPIVATSNLQPKELCDAITERTYSRLVGGALVLELGGQDRRRHA